MEPWGAGGGTGGKGGEELRHLIYQAVEALELLGVLELAGGSVFVNVTALNARMPACFAAIRDLMAALGEYERFREWARQETWEATYSTLAYCLYAELLSKLEPGKLDLRRSHERVKERLDFVATLALVLSHVMERASMKEDAMKLLKATFGI